MYRNMYEAMEVERPLQVAGVINAYAAIQAERAGFNAIYLSGSGVATASYGLPDLGMTGLTDVLADVERIKSVSELPLLVDCDTGWGAALSIARTVREMERAGVAAIHIEDQVQEKRCGHLPGKMVVEIEEMCDRIKAAVDARIDNQFMIMARTDALATDGLMGTLDRCAAYVEAGADAIFAEAVTELGQYQEFATRIGVPILANLTEFGRTPQFTVDELRSADVAMALYPLSAFRAMNRVAEAVYSEIKNAGTQRDVVHLMQTREELYENIGYHEYEQKINDLFLVRTQSGRRQSEHTK
ncbi:MAG: methylisocitrate lyase [Chloroflexi bacterium]|nr:methylisocitrate lyase [Chloroflexota bacterium]MYF78689.1 methylisocitrate lyase [Chloroflexota bacterium]MYK60708.1 methylisocitrate lyase [Chloroflexota bacterium]